MNAFSLRICLPRPSSTFQGFLPCSYLGWTPSKAALRASHSISGESTPPSFLPYSSLHGVVGVLGHINTEGLTAYARFSGLLGSALYDAFSYKPSFILWLLDLCFWQVAIQLPWGFFNFFPWDINTVLFLLRDCCLHFFSLFFFLFLLYLVRGIA